MMDWNSYVGRPYVAGSFDCWALCRLAFREQYGVDLPAYAEDVVTGPDREILVETLRGSRGPWADVAPGEEREGDLVVLNLRGVPRHVGIVIRPGLMLHVEADRTSIIANYRSFLTNKRISGFFRYDPDRRDRPA